MRSLRASGRPAARSISPTGTGARAFGLFYGTGDGLASRGGPDRGAGPLRRVIGDYLRSAVADSVPVGVDIHPYRRYGRFFWSDPKRMNRKHMAMMGHDGRPAVIELAGGRVLVVFAIHGDCAPGNFSLAAMKANY